LILAGLKLDFCLPVYALAFLDSVDVPLLQRVASAALEKP
jgi:hypothetical protein